jgi:hypothetical protein
MPEYGFFYEEIQRYEIIFESDDRWSAEGLMDGLENGDLNTEDLRYKNYALIRDKQFKVVAEKDSLYRTDGEEV